MERARTIHGQQQKRKEEALELPERSEALGFLSPELYGATTQEYTSGTFSLPAGVGGDACGQILPARDIENVVVGSAQGRLQVRRLRPAEFRSDTAAFLGRCVS